MKKIFGMILSAAIFFTAVNGIALASGEHTHVGGPKGGRLLENTEPKAEFFVEKDRSIAITFYDQELKPVSAADQQISVIAETGGNKTTLEFEKKGDLLVSKGLLPDGHPVNLVVRYKQTADDKPRNFRIVYEDHICAECNRAEYACICGH